MSGILGLIFSLVILSGILSAIESCNNGAEYAYLWDAIQTNLECRK